MDSSCPHPPKIPTSARIHKRRRPVTISGLLLLTIYFASAASTAEVESTRSHNVASPIYEGSRERRKLQQYQCQDNPDYRSKMGMTCDKHETVNCAAFIHFRNFDQKDVDELLHNCPKACNACDEIQEGIVQEAEEAEEITQWQYECEDNPDYRSKMLMSCDKHETVDCAAFINFQNFDQEDVDDLLRNCPKACKACPDIQDTEDWEEEEEEGVSEEVEISKAAQENENVEIIEPKQPEEERPVPAETVKEVELIESSPTAQLTSTSIPIQEKILGSSSRGRGKAVELHHPLEGLEQEEVLTEPSLDLFESMDDAACHSGWDPLCADDPLYVSKLGFRCDQHVNVDCTGFRRLGFTEREVYNLVNKCPCSCRIPCGSYTLEPALMETVSPTSLPTEPPTPAPVTSKPTQSPSASPATESPTSTPSSSPVTSPPTLAPVTPVPSAGPTKAPVTPEPSDSPTPSPTISSSASPSVVHSSSPSFLPTASPVTPDPTPSPTVSGSSSPSAAASNRPSSAPSTSEPSNKPSQLPTTTQSSEPSATASSEPSVTRSGHPSQFPTLDPTSTPSFAPSTVPTAAPITVPPTESPSDPPVTSPPSKAPITSKPSASPVTSPPSKAPITSEPSASPVTSPPSKAPITSEPSASPVTSPPSKAPTTSEPSASPVTSPPSKAPITSEPSASPVTSPPSKAPITSEPSASPVTASPSASPITPVPSDAPVSPAPTDAPVSPAPSNSPVSPAPTGSPVSDAPTRPEVQEKSDLAFDTSSIVQPDNFREQKKIHKAFSDHDGTGLNIAWEFEQSGLDTADGGWSVSDDGMSVKFNVEDSSVCVKGGNTKEQSGKANGIIMVFQETTPLHFAIGGMGEMLDEGYESLTLALNGVVIASATSKARGVPCSSGPAQVTYHERGPIYLPSGMHTISLQFTTFDDYDHQNVFYQLDLSRTAQRAQAYAPYMTPPKGN